MDRRRRDNSGDDHRKMHRKLLAVPRCIRATLLAKDENPQFLSLRFRILTRKIGTVACLAAWHATMEAFGSDGS
jgi:hypothetical protein